MVCSSAMNCPVDQVQMRQLQDKGIVMDWCELCDGIWLDPGELARLTRTATDLPALPPQPTAAPRKPEQKQPACPRCGFLTEPVPYERDASLELDRCPRCHGLWLDRGELQAIYDRVNARPAVTAQTGTVPSTARAAPGDRLAILFLLIVLIAVIGLAAALIGTLVHRS